MPHPHRLQSLDMLRGIAVFLVFSYHSMLLIFWGYDIYYLPNGLLDVSKLWHVSNFLLPLKLGWVGVKLFFVLSGFSIHYGTLKIQNFKLSSSFLKDFFLKRFFRLYPAYLFAIGFIILLPITVSIFRPIIFTTPSFHLVILNLLFLYNYTCCTLTPAFWSLGVEVQLYLLYPLFLVIKRYVSYKKILFVTLSLAAFCFFLFDNINLSGLKLGFVGCSLFDWLLGAYLAERFYMGLAPILTQRYVPVIATLLFIGFMVYQPTLDLGSTVASFLSFLLIQRLIYYKELGGMVFNSICSIGKSSYSIYLLHMPLMPYLYAIYHKIIPINPFGDMIIGIPFTFSMMFIIGWLMFQFIETPMINFGKKILQKGNKPTI